MGPVPEQVLPGTSTEVSTLNPKPFTLAGAGISGGGTPRPPGQEDPDPSPQRVQGPGGLRPGQAGRVLKNLLFFWPSWASWPPGPPGPPWAPLGPPGPPWAPLGPPGAPWAPLGPPGFFGPLGLLAPKPGLPGRFWAPPGPPGPFLGFVGGLPCAPWAPPLWAPP